MVELQSEYGLSPIESKALCRRIGDFAQAHFTNTHRSPGQITYNAVVIGEKAGKPLKFCRTCAVNLSILHPLDAEILKRQGSTALKRIRLGRMAWEAYRNHAVLSYEDLALILAFDISTVKKIIKSLAIGNDRPPTRGTVDDIGPSVSHKNRAITLYFEGKLPQEIAARTGHALGSIERYLSDFARVVKLHTDDLPVSAITRITALSAKIVRTYLDIFKTVDTPANKVVLARLMQRFGPL